jgi:ribonuclease P protein component
MATALNSLGKNERLKRRKLIDQLFSQGRSIANKQYRVQYLFVGETNGASLQCGVSVSKRNFKKATDRNRIKRLLREAYRHHKAGLQNLMASQPGALIFFLIYQGQTLPQSGDVNESVAQLLIKLEAAAHAKIAQGS